MAGSGAPSRETVFVVPLPLKLCSAAGGAAVEIPIDRIGGKGAGGGVIKDELFCAGIADDDVVSDLSAGNVVLKIDLAIVHSVHVILI